MFTSLSNKLSCLNKLQPYAIWHIPSFKCLELDNHHISTYWYIQHITWEIGIMRRQKVTDLNNFWIITIKIIIELTCLTFQDSSWLIS